MTSRRSFMAWLAGVWCSLAGKCFSSVQESAVSTKPYILSSLGKCEVCGALAFCAVQDVVRMDDDIVDGVAWECVAPAMNGSHYLCEAHNRRQHMFTDVSLRPRCECCDQPAAVHVIDKIILAGGKLVEPYSCTVFYFCHEHKRLPRTVTVLADGVEVSNTRGTVLLSGQPYCNGELKILPVPFPGSTAVSPPNFPVCGGEHPDQDRCPAR